MKKRKDIFWAFIALFFMAQESWAMEEEDENKNISLYVKPALPESVSTIDGENYTELLPDETLTHVFTFLNVDDLGRISQVSSRWKRVESDPQLWREFGFRKYGDYLTEGDLRENSRKMVIQHYLSVLVNAEKDLERISMLVQRYDLGSYFPEFKKYINFDFLLDMIENPSDREIVLAHGNSIARGKKTERSGRGYYEKSPAAIRKYNEALIETGDQDAIEERIINFMSDLDADLNALREFNERLIQKGNLSAIMRKLEGITRGDDRNYVLEKKQREEANRLKQITPTWYGQDYGGHLYLNTQFSLGPQIFALEQPVHFPSNGYKKEDFIVIKAFIEDSVISEFSSIRAFGKYLKAFALKYGLTQLGYERDYEEAVAFIREHNVPF